MANKTTKDNSQQMTTETQQTKTETQTQETGEIMNTEQTTKTESQENQETKTESQTEQTEETNTETTETTTTETEQTTTETEQTTTTETTELETGTEEIKTEEIKTEENNTEENKTEESQTEENKTEETDEETETLEQYLRRAYFEEDVLKDAWVILKEIKIGKDNFQNLFLFSWHPSILYHCNTVPMGLGLPRDYDQFTHFLKDTGMVLLGKIGLSTETNEPTLKTYANTQLNSTAETVVSELLDPKILKKLVISETCIETSLWVGLNTLYKRLNGESVNLKQITARSVCTPTLKAMGAYKKALKGAMDF